MSNLTDTTAPKIPTRWWHRQRWKYAAASFLLGVLYTSVALLLGFELRLGDREVTLLGGGLIEVSFAAFGYLLGLTVEARRREQAAAEQIQQQLEELAAIQAKLAQQEKLASLGQLAGAIAHEVRNPLAILRSLVQNLDESLVEGTADDLRSGRETCGLLLEEIDRLAHVTSTLVGFARPLTLERSIVPAAEVAARTDLLARQMLSGHDVRLVLSGPQKDEPRLDADPDLVCQVLLGLLENAAAASPRGGEIELAWKGEGDGVELTVTDHGDGVPEELRDKIFEPFFTTRADGNGLGLAVARQIVEAHGGRIAAEPAAPKGTRFRIRLPAAASLVPASLGTAA